MANWKDKIEIEVTLPYTTQGCTLGYLAARLVIPRDSVWISGHDIDSLRWKSEQYYGDYRILVSGKARPAPKRKQEWLFNVVCRTTTHRVTAFSTCDGMNNGNEQFKARVISYE